MNKIQVVLLMYIKVKMGFKGKEIHKNSNFKKYSQND